MSAVGEAEGGGRKQKEVKMQRRREGKDVFGLRLSRFEPKSVRKKNAKTVVCSL